MRMRMALVFPSVILACAPKHGNIGEEAASAVVDPAATLARARAEAPAGAQYATFTVTLHTPKDDATAQGSLVVSPPDHFRLELRGPIGPPALVVVCDGAQLTAWNTMKGQAWRADDPDAALRRLTGEAAGLAAIADVLVGRLPTLGEPTWEADSYRFLGPAGEIVRAQLDGRTAHLVSLHAADAAGTTLLDARFTPGPFPRALRVELPVLGATADVLFKEWQAVSPAPSTFQLVLPDALVPAPLFPS